jgi:hypothetical protein
MVSSGSADLSTYMAIGNSLTAGTSDGSLTLSGQQNSYPQRLFEQFSLVNDGHAAHGPFIQPLLTTNNGFPGPRKTLQVKHPACDLIDSFIAPLGLPGFAPNTADSSFVNTDAADRISNISVPSIRVSDFNVAGYAYLSLTAGPYARRFFHDPSGTPEQELSYRMARLHPTFFTLWLGVNDIFGYASGGGQGKAADEAVPLTGSYYYAADMTPYKVFDTMYDQILRSVVGAGIKGALLNIPDIASIPYYTLIPANGLMITRQTQLDSLDSAYSSGSNYVFHLGANYFVIQDHNGVTRQAAPGELILYNVSQDSILCGGWGSFKPIHKNFVLTSEELQNIRTATATCNAFIASEAVKYKLAYVDMDQYFNTLTPGITFDTLNFDPQFTAGCDVSLDAFHLTQRGYAKLANAVIAAVNARYGSTVPLVDPTKYPGVSIP